MRQAIAEFVTQNPALPDYSVAVADVDEQHENSILSRCETVLSHRPNTRL
ncbi:hypothetical protein CAter10_2736 [Collimonas arenae]|nr:hypothetical protein CAter10_2736 [Collimonas arenae]